MLKNKIKISKILKSNVFNAFILIATFILSKFYFGYYYLRYESLLAGLISGEYTKGIPFDDFFYFGHIGLIKLFSQFYNLFPEIPWLNIILYGYLFTCYLLIAKLLRKNCNSKLLYLTALALITVLFIEHFVVFIYTAVSFIVSFTALLVLAFKAHNKSLTLRTKVIYSCIFILGLITRTEPAFIMLGLVGLFYLLILNGKISLIKIKESILLFSFPTIACISILIWYSIDIKTSDQFHKQIEPELEYELMSRNNIVPINEMDNYRDSLRYTAIFEGVWGDSETNDASFLRSLVKERKSNFYSTYQINNAWSALSSSINKCQTLFYLNIFIFLALLAYLLYSKKRQWLLLLIFQIVFYFILFLKSYMAKMVVTALSPMLFSVTILYLIYLIVSLKEKEFKIKIALSTSFLFFITIHINYLNQRAENLKLEHNMNKTIFNSVEKIAAGKDLYLNSESSTIVFDAFKPFEKFDLSSFDRIIIYEKVQLTTLPPYKKYLSKVCDCNPNDFGEFFSFAKTRKDNSVYLMSEKYKSFLEKYLMHVHDLKINWKQLNFNLPGEYSTLAPDEKIKAYTISKP